MESGFEIEAPKEFNSRIYGLLAQAYNIQGDLGISAEEAAAAAAEEVRPFRESSLYLCSWTLALGPCALLGKSLLHLCSRIFALNE